MRRTSRALMGFVLSATLIGLAAGVAVAHVTVNPKEAAQGSFTKLTFRVPNERPNAATVSVAVQLPQDHPIQYVSVKPVPGWTAEVVNRRLDTPLMSHGEEVAEVVDRITWTGGRIEPGQFQEFEISAGPLPTGVTQLVFPALQRYDTGEEVAWIEPPTANGEEPEHPAPVLTLTPSTGDEHGSGASSSGETATDESAEASHENGSSSSDATSWVAVGLGVVAMVLALAAFARSSRTA
ncbi:YcnI family copper-binding membrane protein [Rhabdothermincola sediminis]|uniref:YcnI family copper-binding membrane protein n=1 Tax=Rhabdothermincola sediminis TaxID=2751370 RepID=UPI001AA00FD4|nr:YcnI family protein [Rhabdothermincola sediminis]